MNLMLPCWPWPLTKSKGALPLAASTLRRSRLTGSAEKIAYAFRNAFYADVQDAVQFVAFP